jgi:hypothetical protein
MDVSLIVDDLFIQSAYERFLNVYAPVYGDVVKQPLSMLSLSCAAASCLGKEITSTHIFYLPDRPSSLLRGHINQITGSLTADQRYALPFRWDDDISEQNQEQLLLARSTEARFHACEFVAWPNYRIMRP